MINRELAERMGLSEDDIDLIRSIRNEILLTIKEGKTFNQDEYDFIERAEFLLQELWGFPKDASKHTWKNRYKFKCQWAGRKFQCTETAEVFTIPDTVEETDFYPVGKGYIDVGRLDSYNRWSGVKEIV